MFFYHACKWPPSQLAASTERDARLSPFGKHAFISKCLAYVVLAWLSVARCTKHTKKNKDFVCQRQSNRTALRETDTESRRDLLKTHTISKGNKRRSQT